jgi:ribosome-associated protein
MSSHRIIDISVEPIELCKLLKIASMVGGGGEAKIVISEGYVVVNNEVEFQKRKKIRHGDVIEFDGETIEVAYKQHKHSSKSVNTSSPLAKSPTKKNKVKNISPVSSDEQIIEPAFERPKRKPISFS